MVDGAQTGVMPTANDTAIVESEAAWRKRVTTTPRPADKPLGRCLVDLLTERTDSGLRPLEKVLLAGSAKGEDVNASDDDKHHKKAVDANQALPAKRLDESGIAERKARLEAAVADKSIRAEFLRFLILGGDSFAPVHEAGIQLWNARIEGDLELRSCKCVSRVALSNCILDGALWMQDARLDVLVLSGSSVKGFHANRAKIAGAMWLDENFHSDGEVELFGVEIGGRLDCSSGHFASGIAAPGAAIGGDLNLSRVTANGGISFVNANVGGSLIGQGAVLNATDQTGAVIDLSRAKVKGDVSFGLDEDGNSFVCLGKFRFASATIGGDMSFFGARITATVANRLDWAIDAQNVKINGSLNFGGGFVATGGVSLYGAEISKDLNFSGGSFRNRSRTAILANFAKVLGGIVFQTNNPGSGNACFKSFGVVSLAGAECGELNCSGSIFYNPAARSNPAAMALNCAAIVVTNSALLRNAGAQQFQAFGVVSLDTAQIGKHLDCGGGTFNNSGERKRPGLIKDTKANALYCGAISVAGSANLCAQGNIPFSSYGVVHFHTARIGQDLVCAGGRFQNPGGVALTCEASKISGNVFLGAGIINYAHHDPVSQSERRRQLVFRADGKVSFFAAYVGLNIVCVLGLFRNSEPESLGSGNADAALDFTSATVGNTLVLGREKPEDVPPVIMGSVNLSGATVRLLVDDGLIGKWPRGLSRTVRCQDSSGNTKRLRCNLILDQFTYERLQGDNACDSAMRRAWLRRQPPEHLKGEFKPQPLEQLITALRAMGYDEEADDIALFKRQSERRAKPLVTWPKRLQPGWTRLTAKIDTLVIRMKPKLIGLAWIVAILAAAWFGFGRSHWLPTVAVLFWPLKGFFAKLGEMVFVDWFVGYGYQMGRAVFLLLILVFGFGWFYNSVFQVGAIEPADKDIRKNVGYCAVWSAAACPGIADQAIPLFNPWLYSADVMVPVVTFGQKAAWAPAPDVAVTLPVLGRLEAPTNFVYDVQLIETVLGWVEGFLLVSFVTGLIAKE
jgi:hypothetical protein